MRGHLNVYFVFFNNARDAGQVVSYVVQTKGQKLTAF